MFRYLQNEKTYWFIIIFLSAEILINFLFSFSNIRGFSLTPYIRITLIFFTGLFFFFDFSRLKIPLKINLKKLHLSNIFVYAWMGFSVIGIFISILNRNSVLYTITDSIYVFFGALLFYISERNLSPQKPNNLFFVKFSRALVILSLICLFFSLKPPALLLVLMVVLLYVSILNRRFLDALLLIIPYAILVLSTNRTQLIVFFLMFFILFLRKTRFILSKPVVLVLGITAIICLFFLRQEIIDVLLLIFDKSSNIGFRIYQIDSILKDGIDFTSPAFVSISQRIIEAEVVLQYWTQDVFSFLFGLGPGATIDGTTFFIDNSVLDSALLGSKQIHNIHLLPFAFIFRYGLFGILFFGLLCLMVYKSFIILLDEKENNARIFWNLFLIFWFFFSIPASSFLWSMPVFWISLSMIKNGSV